MAIIYDYIPILSPYEIPIVSPLYPHCIQMKSPYEIPIWNPHMKSRLDPQGSKAAVAAGSLALVLGAEPRDI